MSKIGKKLILIPSGVEVKIERNAVLVKGPKGEISQFIPPEILVEKKDDKIHLYSKNLDKKNKAIWGLSRALLQNSIKGVTVGFEKKLEIIGIGFKASVEVGKILKLDVGFSHDVNLEIPKDINVFVEKNIITVSGIEKQRVGEFAAKIRDIKPPEPYKGKGIRYLGEKVRHKEGKKAGATTTA